MTIPGRRQLNLAGFIACVGMMGYALYAEHVLMLTPCPLCVFQRMAVIGLGIVFLVAAIHNPAGKGRYVYTLLLAAAAHFSRPANWKTAKLPSGKIDATPRRGALVSAMAWQRISRVTPIAARLA